MYTVRDKKNLFYILPLYFECDCYYIFKKIDIFYFYFLQKPKKETKKSKTKWRGDSRPPSTKMLSQWHPRKRI